jgi:hypothetical protein
MYLILDCIATIIAISFVCIGIVSIRIKWAWRSWGSRNTWGYGVSRYWEPNIKVRITVVSWGTWITRSRSSWGRGMGRRTCYTVVFAILDRSSSTRLAFILMTHCIFPNFTEPVNTCSTVFAIIERGNINKV